VQEEERKLVAYDLHDGLIQQLVGARFYLTTCIQNNPIDSADTQNGIRNACDALNDAIIEARRIIEGLRPSTLDDLGLRDALVELAQSTAHMAGWELALDLQPLPVEPEKTIGVTLYRVAQEALNNARKHADARRVEMRLYNSNGISLLIHDDGKGFNPELVPRDGPGLGITTMNERITLLKGRCEIISAPDAGTTVSMWVPGYPHGDERGVGGDVGNDG
jgi:two-component system NarL family sensor kinase